MKGDFTRNTFDPRKRFSRVLMQQGRVQVDADWNEQAAILLHYLQTLAVDVFGPAGGPAENLGFEILLKKDDIAVEDFNKLSPAEQDRVSALFDDLSDTGFVIGVGRYYVEGVLCENYYYIPYSEQPDYIPPELLQPGNLNGRYLVYLDAWERLISYLDDDSLREVALGGADTAARAKQVWQVKVATLNSGEDCANMDPSWEEIKETLQPALRGLLRAKGKEDLSKEIDPCIVSPEARYRGAENQLYRVEIHRGGTLDPNAPLAERRPTLKFSRDNGSVTFAIRKLEGKIVTLESLGRDSRLGLAPDDWVEIVDDGTEQTGQARPLVQIDSVDPLELTVTLRKDANLSYDEDSTGHPLLRRWDQKIRDTGSAQDRPRPADDDMGLLVEEGKWLTLENGVQIWFEPAPTGQYQRYRTGDYWLIPARTATGNVEWPRTKDEQGNWVTEALPPHGVQHHYAPLAIINVTGGTVTREAECRCEVDVECTLVADGG